MLFKNENLNDEIIEILLELHDHYVPTVKVQASSASETTRKVIQPVLFCGDQLTEERARNAEDARGDGDTDYECLQGVVPKIEDWHAIRLIYQVINCNWKETRKKIL